MFQIIRSLGTNDSEEQDIKPFQKGFPKFHNLATSEATTAAATTTSSAVSTAPNTVGGLPVSLIPIFQPNMFPPGFLPLALNQQALLQASMQQSLFNLAANTAALENKDVKEERVGSKKRKSSPPWHNTGENELQNLALCQPRTSKGKVYSWMQAGLPKRQRAKISEETKREIVEFCKAHTMLKQGEIAEIFGVDRTTVTKMLKRSQDDPEDGQEVKKARWPQYELEDMLFRWMNNTTKNNPDNKPVWSCTQLLEQAVELQKMTDTGSSFLPTLDWLVSFVSRFRLKRLITDYPTSKDNENEQGRWTPLPRTAENRFQTGNNVPAPNHKIPREKIPEYTIVETPLDLQVKIEPLEPKRESDDDKVEEISDKEALSRQLKTLDKFREQQKYMEEANKMKKALLSKTLTERKQRAKQEAHKLEHIQRELCKLDNLLTADVQVIRGKIEEASRDFMEAQKRFEKAEAEYVDSKVDLHNKAELKEQLTEHLYTIIHQNEVRKAKKLADLMKELEMEYGDDEELQLPQLPPLTAFQPTPMPLSPTGMKQGQEQSKFKIVEDKVYADTDSNTNDSTPTLETCDKNSNTIVIKPVSPESSAGNSDLATSDNLDSAARKLQPSPGCTSPNTPSFTIVEDGTVNVVFESVASETSRDSDPSNKSQKVDAEPVKKSHDKSQESGSAKSKNKTKWDFDGNVP